MTYIQYSDHLKVCHYLGKEPGGEFKDFYDFLTELWKDMEFSVINDHNEQGIILHKGTDFYMEQDFKNGLLWCEYNRVCSFFRTKKCMEIPETQVFIQSMVEEHLKCKVSTPAERDPVGARWVEEHLKCKVSTPNATSPDALRTVEEHLKCKVSTPSREMTSTGCLVEQHLKCKVKTTLDTTLSTPPCQIGSPGLRWKNISNAR
jgi:hypothetical protein